MAELPESVRRFLARHINSVEQLEVLLRMKSDPDRGWTAAAVAEALATSHAAAEIRLRDLASSGLIVRTGELFRYAPSDELRRDVDEVADCYGRYRVRVISAIFSQPSEAVRSFSDAFRLRDEE